MTAETIERNAHRIAEALNQRRKTSPVPKWMHREIKRIFQDDAPNLDDRLGALYGQIEQRRKRDYWFCHAVAEHLFLVPPDTEKVKEVTHRALASYYECVRQGQHSYIKELKRKFRNALWSSFTSERTIACRLLEGEEVIGDELAMLRDPATPHDLRVALALRIARLGQRELFPDVVAYFVEVSRKFDRKDVGADEFRAAEVVMGELRAYSFDEWLPLTYAAYCENYQDGPVRGRLLTILARYGDALVEPLMTLHQETQHDQRQMIWRLLHQLIRGGSVEATRCLVGIARSAPAPDLSAVCQEVRHAASDYLSRTPSEYVSQEILHLLDELKDELVESEYAPHRQLAEALDKLLAWDDRLLPEMISHLVQGNASPDEQNLLRRGAFKTINALSDIVENQTFSLKERVRAAWFIPKVPSCAHHRNLDARLWNLFVTEVEDDLRIALLPALAKTEWRASDSDRQKMEMIYDCSGDALRAAITRHWTSLFPGVNPTAADIVADDDSSQLEMPES